MEPTENDWPQVMDLKTAAKYLGFHPVTLRDWKRKGEGPPGRKVGGHWRFLKSALDAYLVPESTQAVSLVKLVTERARLDGPSPKALKKYLKALGLAPVSSGGPKRRVP